MKKTIITIIMMFLIIGIFASTTDAATTSIGSSFNKSEQTVSVTVSFSEKVSAVQFVLNYDSNKVSYISNSAGGQFGESTKRFAYANTTPNLTSITFTFKSRTTGNCSFSIGGLKVKTAQGIVTPALSNSSTSVNMQPNTTSSTSTQQPQTPSTSQSTTSSSKPNTSQSTNKSKSTTNKKKTTKQTTTTKSPNQEQTTEEQVPEQEEVENEEGENKEEDEEQLLENETEKEQNNKTQEENTVNENKIETEIEDKLNSVTRINMVFRIVIMVLVVVIVMFIIALIIKKK